MSAVTFHRTTTANHSETTVGGSRFSSDKIDGTYYVARDGQAFGTFTTYADLLDTVNSTVIAEQHDLQDAAVAAEDVEVACYDLSCLFAAGSVCTCSCGGAGHQLGFTEIKF